MDSENLKNLTQSIGEHIRETVADVNERVDGLEEKIESIPGPVPGAQGERGEK